MLWNKSIEREKFCESLTIEAKLRILGELGSGSNVERGEDGEWLRHMLGT
jgi:hypothetical protein